jgi:general secretion pathway protein D
VFDLRVLARALESDADANILSTPNLLTMDNEEAKIVVGQNVPFITGSFAQAATTTGVAGATVNPFQTIERRDVGLTLRIKPQVAEGKSVKLKIFQEVSDIQNAAFAAGIITNKRSIESTVLVDDGQIIVLGGLIQDDVQSVQDKIPLLGDIPGIGLLFRYETRTRIKTNLMVFLRPVVLRDVAAADPITGR